MLFTITKEVKMKKLLSIALISLAFLTSCCEKGGSAATFFPKDNGKVIATFDGAEITNTYINNYLKNMNPHLKSRYNTTERQNELLSRILETELLTKKAIDDGVLDDPNLIMQLKSQIARFYAGSKVKTQIEESLNVSDDDLKAYYNEHKSTYDIPAKVKASHILVKINDSRKEEEAKKLADQIVAEARKKAKDTKAFEELVKKYSEDEGSKRRGGDLGYFEKTEEGGKMVKEFSDGAFALKEIGDISDPVKSEFGFHVIMLTGKKDKVEKTFDDVKATVEGTVKAERRKTGFENIISDLKKTYHFNLKDDAVSLLDFSVSDEVKDSSDQFDKSRQPQIMKPKLSKEQMLQIKKQQEEAKKAKENGEQPKQDVKIKLK